MLSYLWHYLCDKSCVLLLSFFISLWILISAMFFMLVQHNTKKKIFCHRAYFFQVFGVKLIYSTPPGGSNPARIFTPETVKAWGSSGNVAHRHTWCFSEVNASTQSKFEVPLGMSLAGHTWYCSEVNVSRQYIFRVLKFADERHSMRSLKLFLCRSIDLAETSSVPSSHIPCEPQTLTLSKQWPIWNIECAGERHSLRNL